jgi:hypothetical protein
MRREPSIQRIKADESGRVLDRRRIRAFYLLMLPILLPILFVGAGAVTIWGLHLPDGNLIGGILFGVGVLLFIVYCVYETCLIGFYPARCYLRWLRECIDRRTDAIVASDDPEAFFVQIIPREKWTVSMGENAADVGLLVIDKKRDELRYEGDLERWTVPAECILSFRLESFTPPAGLPAINEFTLVVLVVELGDRETWETPLACHQVRFELWHGAKRRRGAELLRRMIGNLVDPKRWAAVEDADLWPLRPRRKLPEEADFDESRGR